MNREAKLKEIQRLLAKAADMQREVEEDDAREAAGKRPEWAPEGYYLAYHLMAGLVLGGVGALASLLFNVAGASVAGLHPLEIIRVYLTFPMGEAALSIDGGVALGVGCALYLGTGCLYGMLIHWALTRFMGEAQGLRRFMAITWISLALWVVNFYFILSWLQPALFGGNWIVSNIPWFVGMSTHLVFGWTMLFVAHWGDFERRDLAHSQG